MSKEQRKVSIVISNVNDLDEVLKSINLLLTTIIRHYIQNFETKKLEKIALYFANYFGVLLQILGFKPEDFGNEGNLNQI